MDEKPMPKFEEVLPDTYLLKVPFGPVWTGIVLVRGEKNVLIDSSHLEPEQYLLPALAELGLAVTDVDWLLNTHVHGDHIGGHHALKTKYGLKVATLASAADALRDPVKVAIRVRTRFPKNSPPPQSYLKGVEPDRLLDEGELLEGRFRAVATPGHDDDCLTWIDVKTNTAFTGDSLQANGTICQGVGFYRSLPAYRGTLATLAAQGLENLVCGHDYDGIGDILRGKEAVARALDYCRARVELYGEKIRGYVVAEGCGAGRPAYVSGASRPGAAPPVSEASRPGAAPPVSEASRPGDAQPVSEASRPGAAQPVSGASRPGEEDEDLLVALALRLVDEVGCGRPAALFLALHTVSEHLKELVGPVVPTGRGE